MVAASVGILQEVLSDTARSTDCPGIDFAVFHGTALLVVEGDGAGMYHPEVLGPRMATATGYTEITSQEYVRHPLGLVRLGAALSWMPFWREPLRISASIQFAPLLLLGVSWWWCRQAMQLEADAPAADLPVAPLSEPIS